MENRTWGRDDPRRFRVRLRKPVLPRSGSGVRWESSRAGNDYDLLGSRSHHFHLLAATARDLGSDQRWGTEMRRGPGRCSAWRRCSGPEWMMRTLFH